MVRPIEITDALSKAQAVERLQQDAKIQPEALHQLQRSLAEKQTERQVSTPNPVTATDQVVIHVDEREREKHKTAEDEHAVLPESQEQAGHKEQEPENGGYDEHGAVNKDDDDQEESHSHIDIKV